jgi:phosphatidylglycerophosphate synthase
MLIPQMPTSATLMTWANGLTAIRLLCIAPLTLAILDSSWLIAAPLFVIAVLTDFFDGPLARRLGQSSALGGFIDHGTDALFVTCACTGLAWTGQINSVLPVLIPLAFLQYSLDSQVLRGRALKPNRLGRWNGIAYYVLPGIVIGASVLGIADLLSPIASVFAWLLAGSTLLSMGMRARGYFERRR